MFQLRLEIVPASLAICIATLTVDMDVSLCFASVLNVKDNFLHRITGMVRNSSVNLTLAEFVDMSFYYLAII